LQAQQLRHIKDSFHTVRTKVAGEDDTGPFPLFDTPWLVGKALLYGIIQKGGTQMRTEVSLETRIKDQCALAGYDYEYLYRFGKKLLKLYRDVSRNNTLDAEDIIEDICSESYESDISSQMSSALTRLEFFASEYTKNKFESDIRRSLRTGWMVRVMDQVKMNVYTFDDYGPEFVSILTLCYMSSFRFTGAEAAQELGISEQNLYKKKKYAVILFALEFEEYKREITACCNPVRYTGEQMTLADFMH
jgi:hypothetical protein